ncbi:MAG: tetratricopeptide repeat protein [Nibricoccus sp.]
MAVSLSLWKKLILGLAVAILVMAIGVGALELGLRLFGYGHDTRFFRQERDAHGQLWWRENRWVTAPYFPPELIRRPQSIRLPVAKVPGTYRIVVLGSSAAMGDPEPAFSISRQLDVLLSAAYPEIHFEIVNAGITAINSHVVRALANDCAEIQPDLFIVYEGNNEVIGPYGPGTVFSPFLGSASAIRAGQLIKSSRTGQLLAAFARKAGNAKKQLGDWGGMQMFLKNEIDRDDPRLQTMRALFRENLMAIADAARRAQAEAFFCTVLTNQKDFAPFQSRHAPGLAGDDLQKWNNAFEAGNCDFAAGDDGAAETHYRDALRLDDHFADLRFRFGKLLLRQGRDEEAKVHLQAALDLDALRFRTDSDLNRVIRDLSAGGLQVVDLVAAAEKTSPKGVIGDELLYEHVHLNFQGTYIVARELFAQVSKTLVRAGKIKEQKTGNDLLPMAELRHRLAYTAYEQGMIIKEMQARVSRPPFTAQSDNAARQKFYAERAAVASQILLQPENKEGLAAIYERALALRPGDWMLRRNVGMAYVALGFAERAVPLLERCRAKIADDADTLFALALAQQGLGKSTAAAEAFARVREIEPRYPGLPTEKK